MEKARIQTILALGLPIIGGMLSQNILNLIDTAMVGKLGDVALAAVGTGSFVNFMAVAFVTGLSAGVQAIAARRKGEGREAVMAVPLNGALIISLVFGIPVSAVLIWFAYDLFALVNNDPMVSAYGGGYFQIRLFAMVAVGMNFSFRGYWNGIHRPKLYLQTLVIMHVCNIFLNWLLIFGHLGLPAMGAFGAGLGTTISTFLGTAYYFYLGRKYAVGNGFLKGIPGRESFRTILRLAVPNGIQQLFFSGGFTMLFWILGQVSTETTAAATVLINIMLVAILPAIALGMSAASLVSSALGRGDGEDAKQWGWDVVKVSIVLLLILGLPMWAFPELILKGFISDQATINLAKLPLILVGITIWLDGMGLVLLNALLGAGDNRRAMIISIVLQWGLFLPAAFLVGPILGFGLLGIWMAQIAYRAIQAGVFAMQWRAGRWREIQV